MSLILEDFNSSLNIFSMSEQIILVDEKDQQIGEMEKMQAHAEGRLHRAFSVFIFNSKGEMLLQQRAKSKYHSGGLWTNTVCSHPRVGEDLLSEVHRRLQEEMGFDTEVKEIFSFIYKVPLDNDLFEHEFDHVFVGFYDGEPKINPQEAESYKWVTLDDIQFDIEIDPQNYTEWFKIIFEKNLQHIERALKK